MAKIRDMAVVVTGASSGIGRAVALHVAAKGGTVWLVARNRKSLQVVANECRSKGGMAVELPADVTHAEQMHDVARRMVEYCGRIDVWINNAAVFIMGRLEEIPSQAVRRVLDVDLLGYFHGAQAAISVFREQGHGLLINIGSVAGLSGQPFAAPYVAAKAGIEGLSKSLRMELRDVPGIRVCTMRFPSIDTPLFGHAANYTGLEVRPLKPVLAAEAAARAVLRLIRHPRNSAYLGCRAPLLTRIAMMPGIGEKIMATKVDREQLGPEQAATHDGNLYHPPDDNSVSGGWRGGKAPARGIALASAALVLGFFAARRMARA
ncbi:SDR family NAD(P)-dependent oxidoreductase [Geomonas sp. RF6]|uniref:SDR family NAD(P)-dependent oxidoreductase n=1 Tax=Geomonas sp. RF6 TaxID=2897342 RepID=UPI001E4F5229|nr:SDR family NAD(P)-dependent oxidoreductase [Geomonas sp. RF6]UFS70136.1 SDR family NAD(P)-dependent oxidoreductase [Geomonas sp. RF6]